MDYRNTILLITLFMAYMTLIIYSKDIYNFLKDELMPKSKKKPPSHLEVKDFVFNIEKDRGTIEIHAALVLNKETRKYLIYVIDYVGKYESGENYNYKEHVLDLIVNSEPTGDKEGYTFVKAVELLDKIRVTFDHKITLDKINRRSLHCALALLKHIRNLKFVDSIAYMELGKNTVTIQVHQIEHGNISYPDFTCSYNGENLFTIHRNLDLAYTLDMPVGPWVKDVFKLVDEIEAKESEAQAQELKNRKERLSGYKI